MYVLADVDSNCTTGGYTTYQCACGYSYTNNKSALGHNYSNSWTVSPTCTAQGYTVHQCSRSGCSASYNDNFKGALGHLVNGSLGRCATKHEAGSPVCKLYHHWSGHGTHPRAGHYYDYHVICGRNGTCGEGTTVTNNGVTYFERWCECALNSRSLQEFSKCPE